jgi:hypothetical protein
VSFGDREYNQGITHGDFNGDGKIDLAVTNYFDNQVAVLLGNGDGTFASPVLFACGSSPQYIATGDFNEDGKFDLVTANTGAPFVTVLFGDGTGAFPTRQDVPCDEGPNYVAVTDFFGDGHLSIISTHGNGNTLDILRGNGDGTFRAPIVLNTADGPISVAVRDLNGDGKLDLAVVNNRANNVQVFLNQGGGTFSNPVAYPIDAGAHDVVCADFNQDGALDIAVSAQYANNVDVFLGRGDGTFAAPLQFAIGDNCNSVIAEDFNGDGRPDLVTGNFGSNDISVLLNDGAWPLPLQVTAAGGTTAGDSLTVTVKAPNADGTVNTAYAGVVHFSSSDLKAVLPADYAFTSSDQGQHSFTVSLRTAGLQSVTVTEASNSSAPGGSAEVLVSPAALSALAFVNFPGTAVAGASVPFRLAAVDAYGNAVPGYRGTARFRSTDPRAQLPADYAFTEADQGGHDFSAVLFTAGARSVTAADVGQPALTALKDGIVVTHAVAARLRLLAPAYTFAGRLCLFTLQVTDAYGNLATDFQGTVRLLTNDPRAVIVPRAYTFTAADHGSHVFRSAFRTRGLHWLLAQDVAGALISSGRYLYVYP